MDAVTQEACIVSFDEVVIDRASGVVSFLYSARRADEIILEHFRTELHVDVLDRDFTTAEHFVMLCFGLVHSNYIFLPFSKRVRRLQIRAGYFSDEQLAYFKNLMTGALAEYCYLVDLDGKRLLKAVSHMGACDTTCSMMHSHPLSLSQFVTSSVLRSVCQSQATVFDQTIAPPVIRLSKNPKCSSPLGGAKTPRCLWSCWHRWGVMCSGRTMGSEYSCIPIHV